MLSALEEEGVDPRVLDRDYLDRIVRLGISLTVWPAPDWAMEVLPSFEDKKGQHN